jgi:hypothetical protein
MLVVVIYTPTNHNVQLYGLWIFLMSICLDSQHCKSSQDIENFPNMLDNHIVTLSETFSYFMVYGYFLKKEIA